MDLVTTGILLVLSLSSILPLATSISPALLLTPYINQNKTEEARRLSVVNPSLLLNVTSHSGFLTIDQQKNSNTFFWYFPVEGKPVATTPWIVWLQGGPGVSSLAGLFDEIGPFEYTNSELKRRKYAWSNNHSVVFIDNPIGVGYSFTDSKDGFATNQLAYGAHLLSALQQFLTIFPELRKAPLFIAGESYAGRYVPALATAIMEASPLTDQWDITLEGLILGNPVLNRQDAVNITSAFYQWGVIDSQGVQAAKPLQDMYAMAVKKGENELALKIRDKLLDKLQDISMLQQTYNILVDSYKLEDFEEFLAREDIREAIHVGEIMYQFRNETVKNKLIEDFLSNANAMIEELLNKYKILIYCGQLDLTAPCVPYAEARRREWHWKTREEFLDAPRVPWWYDESVAGYVKKGGGFTEVLIRGAGHLAPVDKPAQVLQLITSFIKDIEMELPPNYEPDKETPSIPYFNYNKTNINISTTTQVISAVTEKVTKLTVKPNQGETTVKPVGFVAPADTKEAESSLPVGTIVSIALNVVLVLTVATVALLYHRLKRKSEDFFYNNVENNSDDIFLT